MVDMMVASDTSSPQCCADKTDNDEVNEESFEQLLERLRIMKGCSSHV